MYCTKKGEVGVLIVLALVIMGLGFFALKDGEFGITGAAVYNGSNCSASITESSTLSGNMSCPGVTGLSIEASNVILDCQGYSISSDKTALESGIILNGALQNVTVQNCNIVNFSTGIDITGYNISILNTNFSYNRDGIVVESTSNLVTIDTPDANGVNTFSRIINSTRYGVYLMANTTNVSISHYYIANSTTQDLYIQGLAGINTNNRIYANHIQGKVSLDSNTHNVNIYNNVFFNVLALVDDNALVDNYWNYSSTVWPNILGGMTYGGNYFSNYTGNDTNDDGIGDTANYSISGSGGNKDYLPLVSVYSYLPPTTTIASGLTANNTFTSTNPMNSSNKHSTRQNITYINLTSNRRYVQFGVFFNQTANFSQLQIYANDSALAVNASLVTGANSTITLYANNPNGGNGIIVCPNAANLLDINISCANAISFSQQNITDGAYLSGVKVTINNNEYKIENVTGGGATFNRTANLVIWDETDVNLPYANTTKWITNQTYFFANYTYGNGSIIPNATCTASFSGSNLSMSLNETKNLYETNRSYSNPGTYSWNVTCNKSGFDTPTDTDSVTINGFGALTTDYTLSANLTVSGLAANGSAFTVNTSNVIIDGAGYTILGNGSIESYGINLSNVNGITIRNLKMVNFSNAIYAVNASNATIYNNSIVWTNPAGISIQNTSNGIFWNYPISNINITGNTIVLSTPSNGYGIYIYSSASGSDINNFITNNVINVTGSFGIAVSQFEFGGVSSNNITCLGANATGIVCQGCVSDNFNNNIITTTGNNSPAFYLLATSSSSFNQNLITTANTSSEGFLLGWTSTSNNFISNTVNTNLSYGLRLSNIISASYYNLFLNNNINSTNSYEIFDQTGTNPNYLRYNNSLGDIYWFNDSSNFLYNLTLNVSGDLGIGLNRTVFIGNNTAAVNTSAIVGRINSSANITLRGLSFQNVSSIKKIDSYETNSSVILSGGADCLGTTCLVVSYSNSTGILIFNTTSFSSFTASQNNTAPSITTPAISPSPAYTNSTLNASINYTDGNGDPGTVYFLWYVGANNVYNQTQSSASSGTTASSTLSGGNFSKNNIVNVSVYANDGQGNSTTRNASITISNLGPAFNQTYTTQIANTNALFTHYINCTDADADQINYIDNSSLFEINLTTGLINFTPTENLTSSYSINLTCTDGSANTSQLLPLTVNDTVAPTWANPTNTSLNFTRYQNFTANITFNDGKNLSKYIFSTNASGSWVNTTRSINGTQYNASEQANISLAKNNVTSWYYWFNDTNGNSNQTNTYSFIVQDSILALRSNIPNVSVTSGSSTTVNLTNYLTDIDGESLNYAINTNLTYCTISINNVTQIMTVTGTAVGTDNATINATNGTYSIESNRFWITVAAGSSSSSSSGGGGGGSSSAKPVVETLVAPSVEQPTMVPSTEEETTPIVTTTLSERAQVIQKNLKVTIVNQELQFEFTNPLNEEVTLNFVSRLQQAPQELPAIPAMTLARANNPTGMVAAADLAPSTVLLPRIIGSAERTIPPKGTLTGKIQWTDPTLSVGQQYQITVVTDGEKINENSFGTEKPRLSISALDTSSGTIDLHIFIVGTESSPKITQLLTGNAIALLTNNLTSDQYFVEFTVNSHCKEREKSLKLALRSLACTNQYVEYFGPYYAKENETFLFAQKLVYGEKYKGLHKITTKIVEGSRVIAQNEYDVDLK